jgi:WD40 repeat protein
MALFQWQRIDPSSEEVVDALSEAFHIAPVSLPKEMDLRTTVAEVEHSPLGSIPWSQGYASDGAKRRVTCVWWTDHLGQRHWFVEGDTYPRYGPSKSLWRCRDGIPAHPLWVISPSHVIASRIGSEARLLVVCDCGVFGTPEAIAWTGECCGPCFDRRLDGVAPPARLAIPFRHERTGRESIAFTQDGQLVSCQEGEQGVFLSDPRTGQERRFPTDTNGGPISLALISDQRVVVGFADSVVACWDLVSGEELWQVRVYGEMMGLTASPLCDRIAVDCVTVSHLLDADTGEGNSLSQELSHFAFSADGKTLYAYNSETRSVEALDTYEFDYVRDTGLEFGEPEEDDCFSLACSPSGLVLASGGRGGRVRLGDPKTRRWLWVADGPPGLVTSLAFTPDGRTLASNHDSLVLFWDVETGTQQGALRLGGVEGSLAELAFSPDGETLAVSLSRVRLLPWRQLI